MHAEAPSQKIKILGMSILCPRWLLAYPDIPRVSCSFPWLCVLISDEAMNLPISKRQKAKMSVSLRVQRTQELIRY